MNRTRAAGLVLTLGGTAGYLAGLAAPYPGRAFSVTAVILGITLTAIGSGGDGADGDSDGTERDGDGGAGHAADTEEVTP